MKITSTALALVVAASGAAQSQDVTYLSYGLGFESKDYGGGDTLDTFIFEGAVEYSINQFVLMAKIDGDSFNFGGGSEELSVIGARAGYEFAPGSLVYVGVGSLMLFDVSRTTAEIGAQYGAGAFQAGLHYSSIPDDDIESVTLALGYEIAPTSEVGIRYTSFLGIDESSTLLFGSYESGPLSVDGSLEVFSGGDFSVAGVNGTYEFGGRYRALGGLILFDTGGGNNYTAVQIGAGFQVADNMWIDASYAHLSLDPGNGHTLGLMFSFETGDRALLVDRSNEIRQIPYNAFGGEFRFVGVLTEVGGFGI